MGEIEALKPLDCRGYFLSGRDILFIYIYIFFWGAIHESIQANLRVSIELMMNCTSSAIIIFLKGYLLQIIIWRFREVTLDLERESLKQTWEFSFEFNISQWCQCVKLDDLDIYMDGFPFPPFNHEEWTIRKPSFQLCPVQARQDAIKPALAFFTGLGRDQAVLVHNVEQCPHLLWCCCTRALRIFSWQIYPTNQLIYHIIISYESYEFHASTGTWVHQSKKCKHRLSGQELVFLLKTGAFFVRFCMGKIKRVFYICTKFLFARFRRSDFQFESGALVYHTKKCHITRAL